MRIDRRRTIALLGGCAGAAALGRLALRNAWAAEADDWAPPLQLQPLQVAPGVHYVLGQTAMGSAENGNFVSNAGFVITEDSVVVIDALGSPPLARRLLQAIARITPRPVSHVIVTHYHADHVYGLQAFAEQGARIVAQRRSQAYLDSEVAVRRLADSRIILAPWVDEETRLVAPDIWVDERATLIIGGVRFELHAVGPAHTPDDLVVHLPQRRMLFCGDLFFGGRIPYVGQADNAAWVASLDRLAALPADVVVPGHGRHSTQPQADIALTRAYLVHLQRSMERAARDLEPFDEAYARTDWSRFEHLPLFREANRMNAYNTYLYLEQHSR